MLLPLFIKWYRYKSDGWENVIVLLSFSPVQLFCQFRSNTPPYNICEASSIVLYSSDEAFSNDWGLGSTLLRREVGSFQMQPDKLGTFLLRLLAFYKRQRSSLALSFEGQCCRYHGCCSISAWVSGYSQKGPTVPSIKSWPPPPVNMYIDPNPGRHIVGWHLWSGRQFEEYMLRMIRICSILPFRQTIILLVSMPVGSISLYW